MEGRWTAHFSSPGSEHRRADLVIQGSSGSWTSVRDPGSPREAPAGRARLLSVLPGPSSTYVLWVHASPGSTGCSSHRARLTVVDADTLEGEFDDGRVLRVVRVGRR
jgi:hypothetical protein